MAQASAPVDLIATTEPNTTSTGETLVVTVAVTFAHDPQHRGGTLRLSLSIEQAGYLAAQLRPRLAVARSYRRHRQAQR